MAGIVLSGVPAAGVLVHTAPQPHAIDRVLPSSLGQIKQKRNGRFVTGADFGPTSNEDSAISSEPTQAAPVAIAHPA
jgi:hypothetical protein